MHVASVNSAARLASGLLLAVALSVGLSGCNEPYSTTQTIGIIKEGSTFVLLARLCDDQPVEWVEIGVGESNPADTVWRLEPEGDIRSPFRIELAGEPAGWTVEGRQFWSVRFPLAIRVRQPDGVTATVIPQAPAEDEVSVTGESLIEGSATTMTRAEFEANAKASC